MIIAKSGPEGEQQCVLKEDAESGTNCQQQLLPCFRKLLKAAIQEQNQKGEYDRTGKHQKNHFPGGQDGGEKIHVGKVPGSMEKDKHTQEQKQGNAEQIKAVFHFVCQ